MSACSLGQQRCWARLSSPLASREQPSWYQTMEGIAKQCTIPSRSVQQCRPSPLQRVAKQRTVRSRLAQPATQQSNISFDPFWLSSAGPSHCSMYQINRPCANICHRFCTQRTFEKCMLFLCNSRISVGFLLAQRATNLIPWATACSPLLRVSTQHTMRFQARHSPLQRIAKPRTKQSCPAQQRIHGWARKIV